MAYNHHDSEQPVVVAADNNNDATSMQERSQQVSMELDDMKIGHDEKIEHHQPGTLSGGQPVRPMLTTASEQDPDVAPDIQIRAISMSELLSWI